MQTIQKKLLDTGLVEDNEYLIKYCDLIVANYKTEKDKLRTQSHHIIPRCYFERAGLALDNSQANLVNLKYKDHILAHYYLMKASAIDWFKYSMAHSVQFVIGKNKNPTERQLLATLNEAQECYEIAQKAKSEYVASEEARLKISKSNSKRMHISKNGVNRNVKPEQLDTYLADGYKLGWEANYYSNIREKVCIILNGRNKYVAKDDLDMYLKQGAIIGGRKHSQPSPLKGITRSAEFKANISKKRAGRCAIHHPDTKKILYVENSALEHYLNNGFILGTGNVVKGALNKFWFNNGEVEKLIFFEEISKYEELGYVKGRLKTKK
jgi:hypothetical protein